MQVLSNSGAELDLVKSYGELVEVLNESFPHALTSTVEIFPTTFCWLSMTARDETPSPSIKTRASFSGLSPLQECQSVVFTD